LIQSIKTEHPEYTKTPGRLRPPRPVATPTLAHPVRRGRIEIGETRRA